MKKTLLILFCIAINAKGFSQTSINITYANDSIMVTCPAGPPMSEEFTIIADVTGYNLTDSFTVKVFFGDGTYQTNCFSSLYMNGNQMVLYGIALHDYLISGLFDVTYIVTGPNGTSDTLFHPAEVIVSSNCSTLLTNIFVDNNSNCVYDAGDLFINNVQATLMNGVSYYYNYLENGVLDIPLGVNYTAVIDAAAIQQLGYTLTCPVSGFINFTSSGSDNLNFAVSCNSNYDLAITSSGNPFKIGNSVLIEVGVSDISCIPKSGTYTLNLDPQMSFVTALDTPSSGAGLTYNWNYSNLVTIGSGQGSIYNMIYCNLAASVQVGDTLCYSFSVTPVAGDINPLNNTVNLCYPVKAAWDPNYKDVYPKGTGVNGYIAPNTPLTYTIGFQNTGNDTAKNIYILDTLDNDLDINTMRILYASHPMQFYIINGTVLKFDFQNIQLPDSGANQMLSHGFVVYEISPKQNLANGTQLTNKAGIYFDWNPAVLTNATLNTINISLGINEQENISAKIFPNPVADAINIEFAKAFDGTSTLRDLSGRILITQKLKSAKSFLPVKNLSSGMFLLEIKNKEGNSVTVKKIIKE
ncbi:MAG: T9SS type A sorting domain-containing protein [Bacteroidota bacterium]